MTNIKLYNIYLFISSFTRNIIDIYSIVLLHQKGITINKLATISGITQSTINNIVSGRNNSTTVSTIKKICDGLEITIIEFFNSELFENLEQEIK